MLSQAIKSVAEQKDLAKVCVIKGLDSEMITRAKKGDLHSRRMVSAYLTSEDVVKKLFDVIAPSLAGRSGGYTRVVRTRIRKGDAAPMAQIELLQ